MRPLASAAVAAAVVLTACTQGAAAQSLRDRVARAPDGDVHVLFAARPGVCGDGVSFLRYGNSRYQFSGNVVRGPDAEPLCQRGPVRVEIAKSGGVIVSIRTQVGPTPTGLSGTTIGAVGAADAATWLIGLAGTLEGRPAREALLPAMLADSARAWSSLLPLMQDRVRPYEVRSSAASWLGREVDDVPAADAGRIISALTALANSGEEPQRIRNQALSVLSRMEGGRGLDALLTLRKSDDPWLAKSALSALANSGDPRARVVLREVVRDPATPDGARVNAIRGLRNWATAEDAALLRQSYASQPSSDAQEAILSVIAELGGTENVRWLLERSRTADDSKERSKAISAAQRAGAGSADLARLYDGATDRQTKQAIISALVRQGDRAAMDKLMDIARRETDVSVRKNVLSQLGRTDDPRVKAMLKDLVQP